MRKMQARWEKSKNKKKKSLDIVVVILQHAPASEEPNLKSSLHVGQTMICGLCGTKFRARRCNVRTKCRHCPDCWRAKEKEYRSARAKAGNPVRADPEWAHSYNRRPQKRAYNRKVQMRRLLHLNERPKIQARQALNYAVRTGKVRRGKCAKCGTERGVEAHHPDYANALEVVWLCTKCHGILHHGPHREANR